MTVPEPNAAATVANGIFQVWLAPATSNPGLPTKMNDFDALDGAFVNLGHTTTDNSSLKASQDVQKRMSAANPKNVAYRIDRYWGPATLSCEALEISRATFDAAFGGGTFSPPGADASVKFTPSSAGVKNFVALAKLIDGANSCAFVLTTCANVAPDVTLNFKQGDMLTLPLALESIGTASSPFGWYVIGDLPGFQTGS